MKLSDYIVESGISLVLEGGGKDEALENLVELLGRAVKIKNPRKVAAQLMEREKLGTTGIGFGVAIPHCKTSEVSKLHIVIGRAREEIGFESLDGNPVKLFFMLAAPEGEDSTHLKALAKIARLIKDPEIRGQLMAFEDEESILALIREKDEE